MLYNAIKEQEWIIDPKLDQNEVMTWSETSYD